MITIKVGQIWESCGKYSRRVRVDHVHDQLGEVHLVPIAYGRESWPKIETLRRNYTLITDAPNQGEAS